MKNYVTPTARKISLGAEAATLYTTSEIPSSDNPGYFDTKQHGSLIWPEGDSDR